MERSPLSIPRSQYPNVSDDVFSNFIDVNPSDGGFVVINGLGNERIIIYVPGNTEKQRVEYAQKLKAYRNFYIPPTTLCSYGIAYGSLDEIHNYKICDDPSSLIEKARNNYFNLEELNNLYILIKALPWDHSKELNDLKTLMYEKSYEQSIQS